MTVKPKSPYRSLDERRIASLLTPVLLGRYCDEAPYGTAAAKPGQAWLRWGNAWDPNIDPSLD